MNYKKIKITTIIFLILFSANIFACAVTINPELLTQFISRSDPNNPSRHLAKITLSTWTNHNIMLTRTPDCQGKTIVLVIDDNKTINITEDKEDYKITGMDVVEFQNNSGIVFNIQNINQWVELTTIDINADIQTKPNTIAKLEANEKLREFVRDPSDARQLHGTKLTTKNIFVDTNSVFNFKVIVDDVGDAGSYNATYTPFPGGPAILDFNSITNYGDLKISVIGASGAKGSSGASHKNKVGGDGGAGGDANFSGNYIKVKEDASFDLILRSGDGGNGGKGSSEGGSWACSGSPQRGGAGGNGGLVNLNVSNLTFGQSSQVSISLKSGNGGDGGNAGANHCRRDDANGGAGGNAGDIIVNNFDDLKTSGDFTLSLISGSGGNGGSKTRGGSYGSGGNGGNIYDLNISNFINNSENTKIQQLSGKKGKNLNIASSDYFGVAGAIGNININYLENNKRGLEIIKQVDQTTLDIISEFSCDTKNPTSNFVETGDIYIKYISSGSYLPKSLKTITAYPIDNTKIEIDACYLKSSGLKKLEYQTGQLILNSANKEHILNDFDYDKSRILIFTKEDNDCPICDALELTSLNRVDETYKIYSNDAGTIKAGDLKIYYLKENQEIFKPNYLGNDEEYVVYKNKTDIHSQDSSQFPEAGLFEYVLSKENLFSPRYNDLLSNITGSKAYCPGQQYLIKFTITLDDGTLKTINMPFIPTYGFE